MIPKEMVVGLMEASIMVKAVVQVRPVPFPKPPALGPSPNPDAVYEPKKT